MAFGLLFGSRRLNRRRSEITKAAAVTVSDGIQETLENIREVRATNQEGALSRLLAGKTVLVIAHRMRTVEAADRIVVLRDGRVAEEGCPAELMGKENGIFQRMTQLQSASAGWSI